MKKTFQFNYIKYANLNNSPLSTQELMQHARDAREKAYAPYSKFLVGAALRDNKGNIYIGNNQENAAYPSGLCAERIAIFHAAAKNPDAVFTEMAVTIKSSDKLIDYPNSPCGSCRQVLAEYETKQDSNIKIYFMGEEGPVIQIDSIKDLLPFLFDGRAL